jgi:hypothetical protein
MNYNPITQQVYVHCCGIWKPIRHQQFVRHEIFCLWHTWEKLGYIWDIPEEVGGMTYEKAKEYFGLK